MTSDIVDDVTNDGVDDTGAVDDQAADDTGDSAEQIDSNTD